MDASSRVSRLQQVMGQISTLFPKDSSPKLSAAVNYPKWENYVGRMLATVGAGVDVYFVSGDLMLTPDTTEVQSAQIQNLLTLIIQTILNCTVAPSILDKFETDAAVGFELLVLIKRRYSHISVRELSNLVDSAVDARTKGSSPGEALAIFKNVCYQFNNTPEINQMMGLFYLKMFNSPLAKAKVLDCAAPDLSLSAVKAALDDFSPTVAQTFMIKNNKNKGKRNFKRTPDEITCLRCQVTGHYARDCTAPAPASAASSKRGASAFTTSTSNGFAWMATTVNLTMSDKYLLDTGSDINITVNKNHFFEFETIGGHVSGINDTQLEVKGIGKIKLVHPSTGHEITLSDVHYVPDATQNILSIRQASHFGDFKFSKHKVEFIPNGTDENVQIGSAEGSCCIRVILLAKSILISKLKYSLYCYLNKINKSKINNIKKIRGNKKL